MKKHLITIFLSSLCGFFILAAALFSFLVLDLRRNTERYASFVLNRQVTIGDLDFQWGKSLSVEIDDFHLANASWGSEPDLMRFAHMSAQLDSRALMRGKIRFERLVIDKPEIFLERDADGVGNWKFRNVHHKEPDRDPFTHTATDRADFPTLLGMEIRSGLFRMKTSGGAMLRLEAETMKIAAPNDNAPVQVIIDGAFNGTKARMDIRGGSFGVLRMPSKPYPIHLTIVAAKNGKLVFDGTVMDPIDMDGGKGLLDINAPVLSEILPMFGVKMKAKMPVQMSGEISRAGDHWLYTNIRGRLATARFTGAIKLDEGSRQAPDAVGTDIAFEKLDIRPIIDGLSSIGPTKSSDFNRLSLRPDDKPGVVLDAHLKADQVLYSPAFIGDVELKFKTLPAKIEIEAFSYSIAGGRATMEGMLDATGKVPHLNARMSLANAEISRAVNLSGEHKGELSGPFNARAVLDMRGVNVLSALQNSRGGVVVYMNGGQVAKSLLEKAALDVRSIFRKNKGRAEIRCLIGVYDMHNGTGRVLPLRLRTAETDTDLTGGGTVNLMTERVDLTLKSQASTSGHFALDVPLRFTGTFSDIGVTPVVFGKTDVLDLSARSQMPNLPKELQDLANKSDCVR